MSTIPASQLANVVPGVLSAGGNQLAFNGLFLTTNPRVPIGSVLSFPGLPAVQTFFGAGSNEATEAGVYFLGFTGATAVPGAILFAQYPQVAVAAYLRGGNVSTLTLAQLQAITGTLSVVIDGYTRSSSVNLSSAVSFSSAAAIIQTDLNTAPPTESSFTGSISGTTLTVASVSSGALAVGQTVTGSGVTAGTIITAFGSGSGQAGTYTVNTSQTVGSEGMNTTPTPVAVTYDSVSGAFVIASGATGTASTAALATGSIAASLALTSATGATLSQGAAAATPATFMAGIVAVTQNWVSFMTLFDPDGGSGNTQKLAFSAWNNTQNNRYVYAPYDKDITPTQSVPATGSMGYLIQQANYSGTNLNWQPSNLHISAFVCGAIASIDFTATNGRTSFAYRAQTGLIAGVSDPTVAVNLAGNPQVPGSFGNGYNFYGAYATANQQFVNYQRGTISGPFEWLDSYVNQIWLNNAFQLALIELLTNAKSIPYNAAGSALIQASLADPINAALNFGAIRAGVTLSAQQISEINTAAGNTTAATTISNRGWYLQVGTASPTVRQARGSPPCSFWYCDGESVQALSLASVVVQ